MKITLKLLTILFFVSVTLNSNSVLAKRAAIIIDYDTQEVLFEVNADTLNYPASLAKIMTLYIVFDYLDKNKLSWDAKMKVSETAASRSRSKLYLEKDSLITKYSSINLNNYCKLKKLKHLNIYLNLEKANCHLL